MNSLRLHCLQHVSFEDAANIGVWAKERGHALAYTRLYKDEALPAQDEFDWLCIMGGPMNVHEHQKYPWLAREKEFISESISKGKVVLGVCLGAQLIANAMGAKVFANNEKEIGWYPVSLTPDAKSTSLFADFPETFMAFHWHGDTFEIPSGAIHVAGSEACANQAFVYDGRVVGLQFHLEYTPESIIAMVENCSDEIANHAGYVQGATELLSQHQHTEDTHALLYRLLDVLINSGTGH